MSLIFKEAHSADDLIILFASISGLKAMLTNCLHTCSQRSMSLHASKSCDYFGSRYNADLDDLILGNAKITWNSSFIYLGIHFVNGKYFGVNNCKISWNSSFIYLGIHFVNRKYFGVNIKPIRHNLFMSCNNILSHFSCGVPCDLVQLQLH